jgi:hypothetical protein
VAKEVEEGHSWAAAFRATGGVSEGLAGALFALPCLTSDTGVALDTALAEALDNCAAWLIERGTADSRR